MNDQRTEHLGSILIVDDSPAILHLVSQMLTGQGYQVRTVTNGPQALASVRTVPPDLILLDVMMPGMNGYEVCERLKADVATRDIPIVFISAMDVTADKIKAFAVGGVDYVTKPFQVEEVLARVETHLALRDLQRSLRQEIITRDNLIAELDAYAHTVAHDLKNPLTALIASSALLERYYDRMPEEKRNYYVQGIARNARKMNNIVNELLLLASVREMEEIEIQSLDMGYIVAEALERLIYLIKEHQARFFVPSAEEWPVALGHGPWVEEVWVNYLSNAIKYGGRPPRVALGGDVQPDGPVRFWVHDNGPGLSAEEQARLFTPFERLHQVRAEGHGLGLSIVQRIVERLGGQVGVESGGVPGQGSVFSFTLPGAPANEGQG